MLDRFIEPRVQSEGQAIAGGIDVADEILDFGAFVSKHVQYRAENLTLQNRHSIDFDDCGRHEGPIRGVRIQAALFDRVSAFAHMGDMNVDGRLGVCGDDRPDIGRKPVRASDRQFGHCTLQHHQNAIGRILLHAEDPQSRAALPRAVKGRNDGI